MSRGRRTYDLADDFPTISANVRPFDYSTEWGER